MLILKTLQTLIVAETFATFIEELYFSPFPTDFAEQFPIKKLNQIFASSNVQKNKTVTGTIRRLSR